MMTASAKRTHRSRARAVALLAGLAVLAGCDDASETRVALDEASLKMRALATSGAPANTIDEKDQVYRTAAQRLAGASDGSPSERAAAQLLVSESQAGVAQTHAAEAARLERAALDQARLIRAALADWYVYSAHADAAAAFDPAPELADIDAQVKEKQGQIEEQQQRKAEVESEVARLREESRKLLEQAQRFRRQEGVLRQQALEGSATEGARILEQAVQMKRAGDALEVKAGELEAQAALVEPQTTEIDLAIERLQIQIQHLGQAREQVEQQAAAAQQDAQAARAKAHEAAQRADALLAQLAEHRAGPLAESIAEAARLYSAASSAARQAMSEARTAAQIAIGKAQQALGDLRWLEARGHQAHAAILAAMAEAEPPLPRADAYAAAAEEARASRQAALAEAAKAYEAARDALSASGARGEAGDRLRQVAERIDELVAATGGQSLDTTAEATDEPADDGAATEAAQAPATDGGPEAVVQQFIDGVRAGDRAAVASLLAEATSPGATILLSGVELQPKADQLDRALQQRFGRGLADLAASLPGMQQFQGQLSRFENLRASDLSIEVTDNAATVSDPQSPAGTPFLILRRHGDRWLVEPPPIPEAQAQMAAQMLEGMSRAIDATIAEVNAGQHNSLEEVAASLMTKIQQAMTGGGG